VGEASGVDIGEDGFESWEEMDIDAFAAAAEFFAEVLAVDIFSQQAGLTVSGVELGHAFDAGEAVEVMPLAVSEVFSEPCERWEPPGVGVIDFEDEALGAWRAGWLLGVEAGDGVEVVFEDGIEAVFGVVEECRRGEGLSSEVSVTDPIGVGHGGSPFSRRTIGRGVWGTHEPLAHGSTGAWTVLAAARVGGRDSG
jgi:hypothetical protein